MFTRQRPVRALRRSAVVAAIGVATLGMATVGQAAADTPATGKAVTYNCNMPLLGATEVKANVAITFPQSVKVGEVIQGTDFNVGVTLDANTTSALALIGASTIEGTDGAAGVDVKVNDTDLGVTLNGLNIPSTPIPATGETNVNITGPVPGLTVKSPGQVSFTLGNNFTSQVTPKQADGTPTDLGTFALSCTLDPGQDTSLATVAVTA